MMKKARLELNAEEYTMILTDKNGTKKCLKPEDTIDDNLEPLSEPVKVEFVKYGYEVFFNHFIIRFISLIDP